MQTNLIQNYILTTANYTAAPPKEELSRPIKPLPPKGHLIKGNILNTPAAMFNNTVYNLNAVKHSINGNANDHELGRMNDIGMMLGGLAIGCYLLTKRQTPLAKGMEFVGPAAFFASMAVWPKIAIQLPSMLIHGVNPMKKYEDSFGRKKLFYQDPQYLPWDLYSDEEIRKIGDRLKVPEDIPNRREFIQEKMRKIAVQNNTLWMLSAGFATPIMAGLACNKAEPFVSKWINRIRDKQIDNIIATPEKFEKASKKLLDESMYDKMESFLETEQGKKIDKNLFNAVSDILTKNMEATVGKTLREELKNLKINESGRVLWDKSRFVIEEDVAADMLKNLEELFKDYKHIQRLRNIFIDKKKLEKIFNKRNLIGKEIDNSHLSTLGSIFELEFANSVDKRNTTRLLKRIYSKVSLRAKPVPEGFGADLQALEERALGNLDKRAEQAIGEELGKLPGASLRTLEVLPEVRLVTDSYAEEAFNRVFPGSDETFGKMCKGKTPKAQLKEVLFCEGGLIETLKKYKLENEISMQGIRHIFENTLVDKIYVINEKLPGARLSGVFNKTNLSTLTYDARAKLDKLAKALMKYKSEEAALNKYFEAKMSSGPSVLGEMHNQISAVIMKELGFTKKEIRQTRFDRGLVAPLLHKKIEKVAADEKAYKRICSAIASKIKEIDKRFQLKRYKECADKVYNEIGQTLDESGLHETAKRMRGSGADTAGSLKHIMLELAENRLAGVKSDAYKWLVTLDFFRRTDRDSSDVTQACRKMLIEGHAGDHAVKMKGTLKNSHDLIQYQNAMKLMYDSTPDAATKTALGNILAQFNKYRSDVIRHIGGAQNFEMPNHIVGERLTESISSLKLFNLNGSAPDEFCYKAIKSKYNSNKWFAVFAAVGGGLLAITAGTQFFFGRMKNPKAGIPHANSTAATEIKND
ncbi:MAG: hypothetical protein LBK53_02115 [Heliobacteriaceae bacterium]|jgi:hypothetical protein|nr:hypothetical protein [Heliobacteriaceae bacterium]